MSSLLRALLGLVGVFPLASAQTNLLPTEITSDATWSGPNLIQGTVTISSNAVVRIVPGAKVLMGNGATLVVRGKLLAEGTEAEPVSFTRAAAGQRWKGIRLINAQPSRFAHCVFEYADSGARIWIIMTMTAMRRRLLRRVIIMKRSFPSPLRLILKIVCSKTCPTAPGAAKGMPSRLFPMIRKTQARLRHILIIAASFQSGRGFTAGSLIFWWKTRSSPIITAITTTSTCMARAIRRR